MLTEDFAARLRGRNFDIDTFSKCVLDLFRQLDRCDNVFIIIDDIRTYSYTTFDSLYHTLVSSVLIDRGIAVALTLAIIRER